MIVDDESSFKIKRVFASFGGKCRYKCNHCYTFINDFTVLKHNSIFDITENLEKKDFNIIYISGYNENFIVPQAGVELIEKLYDRFRCHILFTTRNTFDSNSIKRIVDLNNIMYNDRKKLFACISISAYESYKKLEPSVLIPTPKQRIEFIKKLYEYNVSTFLTLRPVCPDSFIPTKEYIYILDEMAGNCTGVISSGIVVNSEILKQLNGFPIEFDFEEKPIMPCLHQDNLVVKYVEVERELEIIKDYCMKKKIPFYSGSIDAIKSSMNYFKNET